MMDNSARWSVLGVLACGIPCILFLFLLFLLAFFRLDHPGWSPGFTFNGFWGGRGTVLFVPGLMFLGVGGLIQLVLAAWVAVDAHRRGMSGFLWGILVFFTFIIGLIVYLIVTRAGPSPVPAFPVSPTAPPPAHSGTTCSQCQAPVQPEFRVCPFCGHSLRAGCPKCGGPVASDWKVCPHCAGPLGPGNG